MPHRREKRDVVELALAALLPLRPISLLALNEVDIALRPRALDQLQSALGLPHSEFFGHVRGTYGNALLSAQPLSRRSQVLLDGGTVVLDAQNREHRIVRGMLSCDAQLGELPVTIAVTHLDHIAEDERAVQVSHILRELQSFPAPGARPSRHTLLLGDLNALMSADYSPIQWQQHAAHNEHKGWGAPRDSAAAGGCLAALARAGFTDCVRESLLLPGGNGDSDGEGAPRWRQPPWTAHAHVDGPRYRIDYVMLAQPDYAMARAGGAVAAAAASPLPAREGGLESGKSGDNAVRRLVPVAARVENATDDGGLSSDHAPVAVDFAVESVRAIV